MVEELNIPLPRTLTPRERGALVKIALAIVEIVDASGYGSIHVHIRDGRVDMVETGVKSKDIPSL